MHGRIDVLCNNAGIANDQDFLHGDASEWDLQWRVNVMSHVWAVRAALPDMLERGEGYLQHTASMAGILTTHGAAAYASTKHAVVGLAEWLSITYHDRGIRTFLLAPLGVNTPMLDTTSEFARAAVGPIKEPDEVAEQVLDAFDQERFLILTDPQAQEWMDRKNQDLERWLRGHAPSPNPHRRGRLTVQFALAGCPSQRSRRRTNVLVPCCRTRVR